ncbi:hypothetical protein [Gordonia amicalis]|uniref:hypothetical protein n=1 Tax=Gordonia amicalis TaxID=89053 RepID=UPI0015F67526|nr:hypothetical protein [Gordonia amicalis]MBA5848141.1 hypothetical protein [Gordonia amicalis]MCZ0915181.1 hypothetical protein [Gordonia amicalis]MDV7172543.1 hypothetical protein [Gordonia amicalis]UKO92803.1 hypothetical protein IHQ52_05300 [Gordonia amicalis]
MNGEGCWSTVVCRPTERAALGLSGESDWLLQCRLAIGHRGNHATDASTHPRHDRRLWLEWNDFDDRAQSLIERNPCPVPSPEGVGCVFFVGHGGPHFYAHSNGHAPSVMSRAGNQQRPTPGPERTSGSQPPNPQSQRMGSHRLPDSHQPAPSPPPAEAPSPEPVHGSSPASAPGPAYRGGRRSTNAEPLVSEDYHGRRHRSGAPDQGGPARVAPNPAAANPPVPNTKTPNPPAPNPVASTHAAPALPDMPQIAPARAGEGGVPPRAGTVGPSPQVDAADEHSESEAARRAAINAALDEVAVALARLAAALRA